MLDAKPKRRRVETTYFDTESGALQQARAALRLRRSGRRWLQCFKTDPASGALAVRHEWELSARGGQLDPLAFPVEEIRSAAGVDLAALPTRLTPVFRTRFQRAATQENHANGTQVEIAFDEGTIEARGRSLPLRELEFEILDGDAMPVLQRLRELVPALGLALEIESKAERGYRLSARMPLRPIKARPPDLDTGASAERAIGAVVGACVAQAAANVRGAVSARDPEYLHQLRVGLRRLRSGLRVFREFAPAEQTRSLIDALRGALPALGAARDWDVTTEALERRIVPAAGGSIDYAPLLRWARRRRTEARREARRTAGSSAFQQILLDALIWAEQAAGRNEAASAPLARAQTLEAFAARKVARLARKVSAAGAQCAWPDPAQRHRLRIRLKRLRYVCEFFAVCFKRKRIKRYLAHLEDLQDLLGELNDIETLRRLLAPYSGADRRLQDAFIQGWLRAREDALSEMLDAAWRAFEAQSRPA